MTSWFLPVALVGYIVSIVVAGIALRYDSEPMRRLASWLFVATWAVHLVAVVRQALILERLPLRTLGEYLLVLGWIVMTLFLWIWFRLRVQAAGVVLAPVAGAATLGALHFITAAAPTGAAARPSAWFLFHTTVSTLGMAILGVAFAMAVIYIFQDRALKSRKTLRLLERLPALERCDRIGVRALVIGFALLSLGIGTGVIVNSELHERMVTPGPKEIFAVLSWFVFAGILVARAMRGYRGRKAAYLTIAGFALGAATIVGMAL